MRKPKKLISRVLSKYRFGQLEIDALGTATVLVLYLIYTPPWEYPEVFRYGSEQQKIIFELGKQIALWTGIYWLVRHVFLKERQ